MCEQHVTSEYTNVRTMINHTCTGNILHANIGYHTPKALLFISCKHMWCVCPSRPFLRTGPIGT
jgi:hypothetical protein